LSSQGGQGGPDLSAIAPEESYGRQLEHGLRLSGESREFFLEGRLDCLVNQLERVGYQRGAVLDFGCGDGSSTSRILDRLGVQGLVGVDHSEEALMQARLGSDGDSVEFRLPGELASEARFSLAYSNGVFHHLEPGKRLSAARYVFERLLPGGLFAFFENNPWNPGTRWVMARIPFDRGTTPLSPPTARGLLRAAGFEIVSATSLFFFPRQLSWFRPLERALGVVPLGAQYLVLARKPNG
jgi:SAM-dependent methyltransferase